MHLINPFLSIILATHNSELSLEATLRSLSIQKFSSYELIIVDCGSTDNTQRILHSYKHLITHLISEPCISIPDAFNKGLQKASGSYINLHFNDFAFRHSYSLDLAAACITQNEMRGSLLHSFRIEATDQVGTHLYFSSFYPSLNYKQLIKYSLLEYQGLFIHKSFFDEFRCFRPHLKYTFFIDFLIRIYHVRPTVLTYSAIIGSNHSYALSSISHAHSIAELSSFIIKLILSNSLQASYIKNALLLLLL